MSERPEGRTSETQAQEQRERRARRAAAGPKQPRHTALRKPGPAPGAPSSDFVLSCSVQRTAFPMAQEACARESERGGGSERDRETPFPGGKDS